MVYFGFSIKRTDPVLITHSHPARYNRGGEIKGHASGTLTGDHSEIYRRAVGVHTDPEFELLELLQRHITDGHEVGWEFYDLQELEGMAAIDRAISAKNWLKFAQESGDWLLPDATAYGRLRYFAESATGKPAVFFSVYLETSLLQRVLDLLLQARRISDADFLLQIELHGPRYPQLEDLPFPTFDEFKKGAALYGTNVLWGIESRGS